MNSGLRSDAVRRSSQVDASLRDDLLQRRDVFVHDRLVDQGPERFGLLQFECVGRQVDEADALGHDETRFACRPALSSCSTIVPLAPGARQRTEAKIGCNVLNRMTRCGMPASARIR